MATIRAAQATTRAHEARFLRMTFTGCDPFDRLEVLVAAARTAASARGVAEPPTWRPAATGRRRMTDGRTLTPWLRGGLLSMAYAMCAEDPVAACARRSLGSGDLSCTRACAARADGSILRCMSGARWPVERLVEEVR